MRPRRGARWARSRPLRRGRRPLGVGFGDRGAVAVDGVALGVGEDDAGAVRLGALDAGRVGEHAADGVFACVEHGVDGRLGGLSSPLLGLALDGALGPTFSSPAGPVQDALCLRDLGAPEEGHQENEERSVDVCCHGGERGFAPITPAGSGGGHAASGSLC